MNTKLIVVVVAASFFGASAFAAGDASFVPNSPAPNPPSAAPSSPSSTSGSWTFWNDEPRGPTHGVPGPIAGAGLPFLLGGYGVYWLIKRRRRKGAD
jgi:hypothetical protein